MSEQPVAMPEHVCRGFRFEDGDVLVFQTEDLISLQQVESLQRHVRLLGERLGVKIEGIVLDRGLRLLCSREAELEHPKEFEPP